MLQIYHSLFQSAVNNIGDDVQSIHSSGSQGQLQIFTAVGRYRGQTIAIKYVQKPCVDLTMDVVKELNEVGPDLSTLYMSAMHYFDTVYVFCPCK